MKAKTLLKFIRKIDYTTDWENNGVPLNSYDRGFRAACRILTVAVEIYAYSRVKVFFWWLWFHLITSKYINSKRCKDGKEETQKVGESRRSRFGEKACLDAPDACGSQGQSSEAKC